MFWLCHVSVSIFLALTDQPINLIYHVFSRCLTSSTGLLPDDMLQRMGTIGALVPIAFAQQLLWCQDIAHACIVPAVVTSMLLLTS